MTTNAPLTPVIDVASTVLRQARVIAYRGSSFRCYSLPNIATNGGQQVNLAGG